MVKKKHPKLRCHSNVDFADAVDIHFSMASKLRHGHRSPSLETLIKIWETFELPADELLQAAKAGPDSFGHYLRRSVFDEDDRELMQVS